MLKLIHLPGTLLSKASLAGALFTALALKTGLLLTNAVPFNGDEAVVGLMARHIFQGARPVFFYGQAYMGSLDAWLVAGAFRFFGEGVLAIRIVQIGLYLSYLATVWLLAGVFFNDPMARHIAVWLAAVPSVLVTTYSTASLGGYGEILLLGNLILWLGYQVTLGGWQGKRLAWLALGFIGGIAFWVHGLAVVYLAPVALLVLRKMQLRRLAYPGFCVAAFLVGSSPWWLYNLTTSGKALQALAQAQGFTSSPLERLAGMLLLGFPAVLNLRFPWSPVYAPWPVLLAGIMIYAALSLFWWHTWRTHRPVLAPGSGFLLGMMCLTMLGVFLGSGYGIDATGRYLLPLALPIVLGLAGFCTDIWRRKATLGMALVAAILLVNGLETARAAASPSKMTTQFDPITRFDNRYDAELIDFLRSQGELRGYTNYWVSFRLAFLSGEEIIYQAALPYKADLSFAATDNRYPAYGDTIASDMQRAYITTLNPLLDACLSREFARLGVAYTETQVGDYHVFHHLTQTVPVEALDCRRYVSKTGNLNRR